MVPVFVFSGVSFSSQNFPAATQPFIRALPLTALDDGLRAIMDEGASLASLGPQLLALGAVAAGAYALALRWFRWT